MKLFQFLLVGIVCLMMPIVSFADQDACQNACDEEYDKDVISCRVDYLNALMDCKPDDKECLDNADSKFMACMSRATTHYIFCTKSCGGVESVEGVIEELDIPDVCSSSDSETKGCKEECAKKHTSQINSCRAAYLEALMRCCPDCKECLDKADQAFVDCVVYYNQIYMYCVKGCD